MSRARQYEVSGDRVTPRAEKPVPTKTQLLTVLDAGRAPVATMPDALMACARLFAMPEEGRGSLSWARTVLNYPAAIRLFEHAIEDGLVVGKLAHEWREAGVKGALQNGATYYASARRALEIQERNEKYDDSRLWEEAGQAAMQELKRLHPEQFAELAKAAYEHLRQR